MKKTKNLWLYGIIGFTFLFIISAIVFRVFDLDILPSQFYGALIGVVITAIITVFLLKGQTANEEQRERSIKVFEKKQDIYHNFMENLKEIIKDGKITIATQDENAADSVPVDELKDLLFELGYIQMHTSEENTKAVFGKVVEIIGLMNGFESSANKQKDLPQFYADLSETLFGIIGILKNDLYGIEIKEEIGKKEMANLLRECNLFVENEGFDRHELQNYFWEELQRQLKEKGYAIEYKDFRQDVNQYYARARNRHRYYDFRFPVYTTQAGEKVHFSICIENGYYYGFIRPEQGHKNPDIERCMESLQGFASSDWWYRWKRPIRYHLDFWYLNSPSFEQLKRPNQRAALIRDIIEEELEPGIQKFIATAKEQHL